MGNEPPRKKTGLIIGVAVSAALVIGGVVALILLFTGGDDEKQTQPGDQQSPVSAPPSQPGQGNDPEADPPPGSDSGSDSGSAADLAEVRELADKAIQALNDRDAELAQEISCSGHASADDLPEGAVFSTNGDPVIDGDQAKLPIKVTYQDDTNTGELPATKQAGRWCMGG